MSDSESPSSTPTVHLIDASPYIFRAYFSLPDSIRSPSGAPVNAVYGFTGFLLQLMEGESPTHGVVAFDRSLTTSFRNEIYPEYKASRELPPEELEAQLDACGEVAEALGWTTCWDERYEADDFIATLEARVRERGWRSVVVTSDKDLAQLVSERTVLWDFARDERYGPEEVRERFGVRPEQIADFLGLAGDPVDNIPGVKGVGKKTAVALLEAFEGLDDLYGDLDRVAGLSIRGARSLGAKLEASREIAFLSRDLATVSREAPASEDPEDLAYRGADRKAVDALFDRLGFEGIRERVTRLLNGV